MNYWFNFAVLAAIALLGVGISNAEVGHETNFGQLSPRTNGMLVSDAEQVLAAEGRHGPPDAVLFSRDRDSYRWVYFPAIPGEISNNESITVRTKGNGEKKFENVVLATKSSLARRGIPDPYALIEFTVNGGFGSAAFDTLVASDLRRLDGTHDFAFVSQLIPSTISDCNEAIRKDKALLDAISKLRLSISSVGAWVLQTTVLPFVTWLSETRQIEVTCDGELSLIQNRNGIGIVPQLPDQRSAPGVSEYGRRLSARQPHKYSISRSGAVLALPGSPIETKIEDLPPPG